MTDTEAAEKVELAQKHINYQRQRIVDQKELITRLKRDHETELLPAAHELLKDLEHVLAGLMAEQGRARQRDLKRQAEGERDARPPWSRKRLRAGLSPKTAGGQLPSGGGSRAGRRPHRFSTGTPKPFISERV
jgi:hypothetical protein